MPNQKLIDELQEIFNAAMAKERYSVALKVKQWQRKLNQEEGFSLQDLSTQTLRRLAGIDAKDA